jgi:hypothetical protein
MEPRHPPTASSAISVTLERPVKVEAATQSLMIQPAPLRLEVNTSTDWAAVGATSLVGLGSIVTAAAVAYITRANQKSQNRAHTANLRQRWQEELRNAVSEYMGLIMLGQFVSERYDENSDEFREAELNHNVELMKVHSKILLMLDKKQKYSSEIEDLMKACTDHHVANDIDELAACLKKLRGHFRDVLEKTWGDIKSDLNA